MTRCVDKACTDGPPVDDQPMPRWATHGLLCARCADRLEQRIAEMPARADQLRSVLGGLSATDRGENRPTKGNPPVPLNVDAHDLLVLIEGTVVSWVRMVAEERGLRGPDRQHLPSLCGWLVGQIDWLPAQLWVDDLAEEMRTLSRSADSLTRANPARHRLPAPCPACAAHELGRRDGASEVTCAACGSTWPEQDYDRLVLVLGSDPALSLTAVEAAARAGVEPARFRQWVSRGKVRRVGTVDGLARYATADVDAARERSA